MTDPEREESHGFSRAEDVKVILYNDPHPVHQIMADAIDASLVPTEQGGLIARIRAAGTSIYNGPVIIEGGVPLLQGAFLKLFGNINGPLIMLAADETLHNIVDPLPYYSRLERATHRRSIKMLDGIIAVSQQVKNYATELLDVPVTVCEPFVLDEVGDLIYEHDPDLDNKRVLCVGENRPAMNHDALIGAVQASGADELHLVGSGTDEYDSHDSVYGHGYVDDEKLAELYSQCALYCLPARASAFPVTVLEALQAGVPAMCSSTCGTSTLVRRIDDGLVTGVTIPSIIESINRYFRTGLNDRRRMSELGQKYSSNYTEAVGRQRFRHAYEDLMEEVGT